MTQDCLKGDAPLGGNIYLYSSVPMGQLELILAQIHSSQSLWSQISPYTKHQGHWTLSRRGFHHVKTWCVLPLTLATCLPLVLLKRLTSLVTDSCILRKLGRNRMTSTSWLAKCLPQLMPWAPWMCGPHRRTTVGLWWTFFGVSLRTLQRKQRDYFTNNDNLCTIHRFDK